MHCISEDCDGCVSESLEMVGVGLLVGNGKGFMGVLMEVRKGMWWVF